MRVKKQEWQVWMIRQLVLGLFIALVACASVAGRAANAEIVWHEATEFTIEGRGWTDTESVYDRLPTRAKGSVPDSVWGLGKQSAGICVRFQTNAHTVSVRWELTSDNLAMPHMPATGVSGVDLYCRAAGGAWRFVQNGRPAQRADNLRNAKNEADKPYDDLMKAMGEEILSTVRMDETGPGTPVEKRSGH